MLTDDEIQDIYSSAVDASMRAASERDGFASNMTRESRVAGLRAIEREAAARALEEVKATIGAYGWQAVWMFEQAIKEIERARAAEARERKNAARSRDVGDSVV